MKLTPKLFSRRHVTWRVSNCNFPEECTQRSALFPFKLKLNRLFVLNNERSNFTWLRFYCTKFIIEKFPFPEVFFCLKTEGTWEHCWVLKINENKSFFYSILLTINLRNWSNFSNKCSEVFAFLVVKQNKNEQRMRRRKKNG